MSNSPAADTSHNPIVAYGRWLAETPDAWPDAAIETAHHAFIDIVGVGVRGAAEDGVRRLFEAVKPWGDGPATVIGMGARLAAPWAALVNGAAAHILDFDDNFNPGKTHATAVLAPAILALAEQEGASGRQCLDAYIAGLQVLGRIGEGLNPPHRQRGWHATATVGALGAAAAAARLLRLDAGKAAFALSIATSMAGGFMSQFGTTMKSVHAGLAAKAGVLAAGLARTGVDAGLSTLEGRTGMTGLMVGPDYEDIRRAANGGTDGPLLRFNTDDIGDPLLILSEGLRFKRFPNCAGAHRSMDCLLKLMAQHDFTVAQIREIVVHAPRLSLGNLMFADPQTPLEAKFSLQFALATLLVDGDLSLSHFSDDKVMRPEVRAIYPLIRGVPFDAPEGAVPTRVEIVLNDGRTIAESTLMAVGSIAAPFTPAQFREKLALCIDGVMPDERAERLKAALEELPKLETVAPLMALLGEPVSLR